MAELHAWSITDASNNSAAPLGWATGTMVPSEVEPTGRAMMGVLARFDRDNDGSLTTGGTATAITVTLNSQHAAWFTGLRFKAKIGTTSGATPTINPTGSAALGAKSLYTPAGAAIVSGALVAGGVYDFVYDGTNVQVLNLGSFVNPMTTAGDIIYSSTSTGTPSRLALGTQYYFLTAAASAPAYVSGTTALDNAFGSTQGNILSRTSTAWAALSTGTAGMSLRTRGASANVTWVAPMFRAACSTATTLTASTWVKIPFSSETFDTNSNYDNATNYRFTPTIAGKYLITVRASTNMTKAQVFKVAVYKNGSAVAEKWISHTGAGADDNFTLEISDIQDANGSTDYFEGFAWCDDTSPSTLIANASLNIFTGAIQG